MRFIDREAEMKWLAEMYAHSRNKLFPVVIYGPRRVGKTALARNFIKARKAFYIYVNETKSSHVLALEVSKEMRGSENLDSLTSLESWTNVLKYLIEKSSFEVVVFDEFQNFLAVDKSVLGTLQDLIDRNEGRKLMLVFQGSSAGMLNDVFEESSAALYGRMKAKLRVKPLTFLDYCPIMRQLGFKDSGSIAGFFFVFGGYPKYLTALEDFEIKPEALDQVLESLFFRENAPLQDEARDLLRTEFGSRGAQNYAILEAIASGHTKLSEIASYVGMPATSVSAFMSKMCDYHDIVERAVPLLRPSVKDTRYAIKAPLLRFWFRFIRPYESQFELGSYDQFMRRLKEGFDSYAGREFERLSIEYLQAGIKAGEYSFSDVGSWWHKDREIDVVALGKEACVWECKWKKVDGKQAAAIAAKLKENAEIAGIRDAKLGLFAREIDFTPEDFDYVITLGDMIEGKFPHSKRRTD